MRRILAGLLLGLTVAATADGAAPACLDGAYQVAGEPLLPTSAGGVFSDVVRIADGTIAIASGCPPVAARVRASRRGTVVRATWRRCGTAARVRLRALVDRSCAGMQGVFASRRPPLRRRFTAGRTIDCATSPDPCPCGGIGGIECPTGTYCDFLPGTCQRTDAQGVCAVVPGACPTVYDPVCGCDGVTYGNDCERQAARAQKAHAGRCATEPECRDVCDCIRTRSFPEPCSLDCATCDNYWECDGGTCVPHCGPVPQPPPVCDPEVCGGIAGVPCPTGRFCELPKGECDSADLQGVCLPRPEVCPELYAPVCGCDAVTYSTDCDRQQAGVQLAHGGPCGSPCDDACDCAKLDRLPVWCDALMCPACECAWRCDDGRCAVQVVTPPDAPPCDGVAR